MFHSHQQEIEFANKHFDSVLTRPEDVQAVFRDSDKHFKAENNNSGYLMSQILGRCVGLISRDDWKRVRSIMEQPFVRSTSTAYLSQISRRTKSYFRELSEKGDFSRGSLAPADDLKLLPFLVVAEIVYGAPLAPEVEKELRELAPQREALFRHVIGGGISRFSWSKYLPIASNRELAAFQQRWLAFNELAYRHAVEEHPGAPIVTFFQARASGELSTAELLHTLDEILYANLDVTAGGMSWNIVFLAAHRDVQTRLRAEIASKRAEAATYQDEELPSTYMLSSFTLLAACVNESARLRPLAAFSVPQSVPSERVVSGYQFPRRTNFIVDSYALNIRNPHWGEDRASYRPDRFLAREATSSRYHYWRFGFGPRQCMGRYVADAIIRAIILHLVENYELRTEGKDAGDWERNKEIWIDHPDLRVSCVKMSN